MTIHELRDYKIRKVLFFMLLAVTIGFSTLVLPSLSQAALIFSEDFNSATGTGTSIDFSEKWSSTIYYGAGASVSGWTFGSGVFVAQNKDNEIDKAMLLNETPQHGSMSKSIGVIQGTNYILTFDHWGDNRPGGTGYRFTVSIDGSPLGTISRIFSAPGTGVTETISFTASSNSIILSFLDSTPSGQASPIIDNIKVSTVPIPPTIWLLGPGLIGLAGLRRRFKK